MTKKSKNEVLNFLKSIGLSYDSKIVLEQDNEFSSVVSDLVSELGKAHNVSSNVYALTDEYDYANFVNNLEKFLKSYGCPYTLLTEGPVSDRFSTVSNRSLLLQYLCSEIMAVRQLSTVTSVNKHTNGRHHPMDVDGSEDDIEVLSDMHRTFTALGLKIPPNDSAPNVIYSSLQKGISDSLSRCPPNYMGKAIIPLTGISDRQWSQISRIAALLQQQYASRQATLLKRLDVTVQSFKWSDKAKSSLDKITTVYNPIRGGMGQIPYPGVPNVLAVRDNMILQIEKTSGKNARRYTSCDLNKILIGKVPDRGGRAWELEPPPPEMPAFKQRQPDRGGGPQRGGHRGGGYGDRGYSCGGYPNETRSDIGREGGGIGVGRGSYTQIHSQPMPPCTGGGGYMTDPYQMASISQQMSGMMLFEPGLSTGPQQGFVFQPTRGHVAGDHNYGRGQRGGGRGGRGGRPY
ncbi:Protein FAM98A [Schistosoma japonicum]|nr:Protein FAM98A [Schistosoma japonicum]